MHVGTPDSPLSGPPSGGGAAARRRARKALLRWLPRFRIAIAARAALGAMAAWLVANNLPGELHQYAYAAPLGAFIATGSTVFTIARTAMQQTIGLILGAALGLALLALDLPGFLAVGIIAVVAVVVQGFASLGIGGAVVPVVALLVIIFGGVDADNYAVAYVAQFTVGLAIGVVANLVIVPPLHDREAREQIRLAIHDLADRTGVIAAQLRGAWPPPRDDWAGWGPELELQADDLGDAVRQARESRMLNPRTIWRPHDVDRDARTLASLRSIVHRMAEVLDVLAGAAWGLPVPVRLDADERALVADALDALGEHLRALAELEGVAEASRASAAAIDALYRAIVERDEPESGSAAVVFALRAMRQRLDRTAAEVRGEADGGASAA